MTAGPLPTAPPSAGRLPRRPPHRPLLRASAAAVAGSALLAAAVHLLARLAGDELLVTPPGASVAAGVPLVATVGAAVVGSAVGAGAALALTRTPRPRPTFVVLALAGLGISFASPAAAATTTATALWLSAMHVAVAAVTVPLLARALPAVRAR